MCCQEWIKLEKITWNISVYSAYHYYDENILQKELEQCHIEDDDDEEDSAASDEPGDAVLVAPEISLSTLSVSSSSSFITSSEDDHAISEDISSDTSGNEEGNRRLKKKIRDRPISLNESMSSQASHTRDDEPPKYRSASDRFYKKRNRREEFWDWRRPCLKNHKGFLVGDSMLRCFNQIGYRYDGYRISAFGGCELLEMISLLKSGQILRNRDTRDKETRDKLLSRELELPLKLKCSACDTNCTADFTGQVLISVGINNSLHAPSPQHIKFDNELDNYVSDQDFEAIYELLDDTVAEVFPNATVRLVPLIAVEDTLWKNTEMMQEAFVIMNGLIRSRNHVDFDSYLPVKRKWLSSDKIHFKSFEGVEFWKTILKKLE